MNNNVVILIPARYGSSRFPGKPLARILGEPMISRVYSNMSVSGFGVYVVTDNDLIEKTLLDSQMNVLRVDDDVVSGSERIYLAQNRFLDEAQYIVNVQGDEPLLPAFRINELVQAHQNSDFDIMTIVIKREGGASFDNSNIVKVVYNPITCDCQYFSRSGVPAKAHIWYQHVGVYCYKKEALASFEKLPVGSWEATENLEQLRALEAGFKIGAILIDEELVGVDTPEDILRVEEILNGKK